MIQYDLDPVAPAPRPQRPAPVAPVRPRGVTALAVLQLITTLLALLLGAVLVPIQRADLSARQSVVEREHPLPAAGDKKAEITKLQHDLALLPLGWETTALTTRQIVAAIMVPLGLLLAYGFWRLQRWAWWLTVMGGALGIVVAVIIDRGVLSALISAATMYYLSRPHVRDAFDIGSV